MAKISILKAKSNRAMPVANTNCCDGVKISEMTEKPELAGEEMIPIQDGINNFKVKASDLAKLGGGKSGEEVVVSYDNVPPAEETVDLWVNMNDPDADISTDAERVIAAAMVENAKDIDSLKNIISCLLRGKIGFDSLLTKGINIDGAPMFVVGNTTPSEAPDFSGQFYIDETGKRAYIAVGKSSTSDWKTITN